MNLLGFIIALVVFIREKRNKREGTKFNNDRIERIKDSAK